MAMVEAGITMEVLGILVLVTEVEAMEITAMEIQGPTPIIQLEAFLITQPIPTTTTMAIMVGQDFHARSVASQVIRLKPVGISVRILTMVRLHRPLSVNSVAALVTQLLTVFKGNSLQIFKLHTLL
jgi:hypothetical protein